MRDGAADPDRVVGGSAAREGGRGGRRERGGDGGRFGARGALLHRRGPVPVRPGDRAGPQGRGARAEPSFRREDDHAGRAAAGVPENPRVRHPHPAAFVPKRGLPGKYAEVAGRGLGPGRRRGAPRLHRLLDVDRSGPGDLGDPADQPRGVRERQPETVGASPPDPRRRVEGDLPVEERPPDRGVRRRDGLPRGDAEGEGVPGHRIRRERLPADEHAAREPRHPARLAVRGGEHPAGRGSGGRGERGVAGEPGGAGGGPPRCADPLDAPGGRAVLHRGAGIDRRGGDAREDDGHVARRLVPLRPRGRPVVPRGRGPEELPRELPARAGAALRDRGGRVRHRVFRQGAEVPPLPAPDRPAHERRVRPRRHLPRSRPRPGVVPQTRGDPPPRRPARGVRRLPGRRRGGARGALPGDLLRDAGRRASGGIRLRCVGGAGNGGVRRDDRLPDGGGGARPSTSASPCRGSTTRPTRRASRSS